MAADQKGNTAFPEIVKCLKLGFAIYISALK